MTNTVPELKAFKRAPSLGLSQWENGNLTTNLAEKKESIVGGEIFTLRAGETLIAPRNIPHQLRNSGKIDNHYLIMFSPSGFEDFLIATSFRHRMMRSRQLNRRRLPFGMSSNSQQLMGFTSGTDMSAVKSKYDE